MQAMAPDLPVVVVGRLDIGDDAVKLLADSVCLIDDYVPEVRVRVRKAQENGETFGALKRIFGAHRGKSAVFLHLVDSRKVIKAEEKFWLTPTQEAIADLEALLGEGAVQIR